MSFKEYIDEAKVDWLNKWENDKDANEEQIVTQTNNEIKQTLNPDNLKNVLSYLNDAIRLQDDESVEGRKQTLIRLNKMKNYLVTLNNNISLINFMIKDKL